MTEPTLTRDEHHALDWLSQADASLYGECRGRALDRLLELGLAKITKHDERGHDWDVVCLTDAGFALSYDLGPWNPKP